MAKNDFDELMSVGIDIGKDVFHLVGFDREGQRVSAQEDQTHGVGRDV